MLAHSHARVPLHRRARIGKAIRRAGSALAAFAAFAFTQPAVADIDIQHWQTPSGVPVYYVHAPQIPMVDIVLQFDAGHTRSNGKQGIAGLTSSLLNQGAGSLTQEEIIDRFDDIGARFSASADMDKTRVGLRSLRDDDLFDQALQLFITLVSKPDFPVKNFNRAKKQQIAYIKTRDQNIANVRGRTFGQAIYKGHLYGIPGGGTEKTVGSVTREDVVRFHRTYYVRNNMNIVIVGDIERPEAENTARRITDALRSGEKPPPIPPVPPLKKAARIQVDFPSQQTHVIIGQPFIKVGNPDFYALYMGNHILGGSGFGSRLMEEIRVKRGLAYSSGSGFQTRKEAGAFSILFQTRADQADLAQKVAMDTLTDFVNNGPSKEELELARDSILGSLPMRFSSNSSILNAVARITYYELPLDYLAQFKPGIESVTHEDIVAAFRRHIQLDKLVTVVVGGDQ